MNAITVEHLSKQYRLGKQDFWALRDVSFEAKQGEILGIIGPNGAGKTTLLKILARVSLPTEGRITGRGRVVPLLEIGFGFRPDLSGRENIFLNAAIFGIPRVQVQRKLDQIIEFADVKKFIDAPLRHYSSGMYLRLAFSVAINTDPEILLADEILAVGDQNFQESCLERVRAAGDAGMTVLFVSHDMSAVTRLCDRTLWIDHGEIIALGATKDIVSQYQDAVSVQRARKKKLSAEVALAGRTANRMAEILSVSLHAASGDTIGAVRISEQVLVKLAFRAIQPGIRVRCAFDFYVQGVHAFRSTQPVETCLSESGIYSARARIPAHLLTETTYTVTASLTARSETDAESKPLIANSALSFQAYDVENSASVDRRGRGVVSPRLEWDLAQA